MGALDSVEWESCLLEPLSNPAMEREVKRALGMVPPAVRYFVDAPWLIRTIGTMERVPMRHLSTDLVQMTALVVSQVNSCRYCYTATRSALKILGFPDARIRRLEEDFLGGERDPADKAALEFARCVARATPLASAADARACFEAGSPPGRVKEVAFVAASNVFFNRLTTTPALPPAEVDIADRWMVRLMRPVLVRFFQPRDRILEPREATPAGPFRELLSAFGDLPLVPYLRSAIDAAWSPSALDSRLKALVLAVVARGVGAAGAEREAVDQLVAAGKAPEQVADLLAHLSAVGLDPLEQAAASLARESIWYRPAPLQRHARAVRGHFSRQQFVELVGITALANALCRLAVVIEIDRQGA